MDKRLQEAVGMATICVYGPSLVGKTTLARRLSSDLALPMRSCGEKVRSRAAALGIEMTSLSDNEHRHIDLATRTWAAGHRACVVEGRFLDLVFSDWHVRPLLHILLAAPVQVRYDRARVGAAPLGAGFEEGVVKRADEFDLSFKQRMYADIVGCPAQVTIDTSTASIEDCVTCIRGHISDWGDGMRPPI